MVIFKDRDGGVHVLPENEIVHNTKCRHLICYKDGYVLVVHAQWTKRWEFPGGHAEKGESVKQNLLRELREETGYTNAKIGKKITSYPRHTYAKDHTQFEHSIKEYYEAEVYGSQDKRYIFRSEIGGVAWKKLSELHKDNFSIHHYPALVTFRGNLRNRIK